jgi:DnaJ family protein C protein 3
MILVSRKAAMTAHPDKGGSEAKMAQVNEAYEPLSNPGKQHFIINTFVLLARLIFTELRQRFDNGDDPNDPGSQGGAPFTGYRSPFGGGIRLRSFSSRLGSAGFRLVEAIDDLIFPRAV